ncbi:hypothetical protein D9M72_654650 [compost metagenome]
MQPRALVGLKINGARAQLVYLADAAHRQARHERHAVQHGFVVPAHQPRLADGGVQLFGNHAHTLAGMAFVGSFHRVFGRTDAHGILALQRQVARAF